MSAPSCPKCGQRARKVRGSVIYPHLPKLADTPFWSCAPCGAYVGCHPGTSTPLGTLADAATRQARLRAHNAFDRLWKCGTTRCKTARREAYRGLREYLGLTEDECHIGLFDVATCARVVEFAQLQESRR